jgi:hypothetical protein
MCNLQKIAVVSSVLLAISSLNIGLFENPAQAAFNDTCYTGKFYVEVKTNSHGQLVYQAFQGNYTKRPHRDPDLVLYNGKITSRKKVYHGSAISRVIQWGAAGGFIYQITQGEQISGDTGATWGELLVKQNGKVLYQHGCQFDD